MLSGLTSCLIPCFPDSARLYGNEAAVGAAVRDSGLERGEVFIVSKVVVEEGDDVGQLVQQSVQSLGLG